MDSTPRNVMSNFHRNRYSTHAVNEKTPSSGDGVLLRDGRARTGSGERQLLYDRAKEVTNRWAKQDQDSDNYNGS
jgi:hypothetical protein